MFHLSFWIGHAIVFGVGFYHSRFHVIRIGNHLGGLKTIANLKSSLTSYIVATYLYHSWLGYKSRIENDNQSIIK